VIEPDNHDSRFEQDIIEELLERLRNGDSMRSICADQRMPDRETVRRWSDADDALAASIARARDVGYHDRAERAVENAKEAKDAGLGRLAFDAERWYLSKLSRAFADKVTHVGDPSSPIAHSHDVSLTPADEYRKLKDG
jgi:hypothetical protein